MNNSEPSPPTPASAATATASLVRRVIRSILVVVGAGVMTSALFLVLPLIQMISEKQDSGIVAHALSTGEIEPPPPAPEEEEPKEEEKEDEPPPELDETPQNLDLNQLELVLNPQFGDGLGATIELKLDTLVKTGQDKQELFTLADLDQKPRATYQPSPQLTAVLRKKVPATVWVLFIVNERGRVESPKVQKSSDPTFDRSALSAIKKWKFEPGKRSGKPVRFRMRVPITFPEG